MEQNTKSSDSHISAYHILDQVALQICGRKVDYFIVLRKMGERVEKEKKIWYYS